MKKNWWRRTSMLLIAVTMPVALAAAPATAATGAPAGHEYVGACNMLHAGMDGDPVGYPAPDVGVDGVVGRGMWFAMALHTAPQGDAGMMRAVARSGCS